jgi:hypothetical protein
VNWDRHHLDGIELKREEAFQINPNLNVTNVF